MSRSMSESSGECGARGWEADVGTMLALAKLELGLKAEGGGVAPVRFSSAARAARTWGDGSKSIVGRDNGTDSDRVIGIRSWWTNVIRELR